MIKNKYVYAIIFFILVSLLFLIGCGRKGSLNPNSIPRIEITQYTGISKPDTIATDSTLFNEIGNLIDPELYDSLFYQEIYWNAWDEDGVIISYAYRIGSWDSLASEWLYNKAFGIETNEDGWVLHEQPNGDMSMWTSPDKRFPRANVYFPSIDTTDFRRNFGKFEVLCKDNRGAISDTAKKYFVTWSDIPITTISTSQGRIDGKLVGTAILFEFTPIDNDPFNLGMEAAYYNYRLVYYRTSSTDTVDIDTENLGNITDSTDWYTTKGFRQNERDKVLLRDEYTGIENNKPELRINEKYPDGTFELTQIQVKAVDKACIEDPNYAKMTFFVRGYFTPGTMPFMGEWESNLPDSLGGGIADLNILPHIYILGENTYLTYMALDEEIPKKYVDGQVHYGDQFYMDLNENLTAIWSEDMEIYLIWQYLGQYGYDSNSGRKVEKKTYYYDSNLDKYIQYYCDAQYMDIQLDGEVGGLPPIGTEITDETTGEKWRRIPIDDDQNCKLFDIAPGYHIFKVRTVDFQDAVDPTPECLEFYLYEKVAASEKSGVLLVDDTYKVTMFAEADSLNIYYNNLLSNCSENVHKFDLFSDSLEYIYTKNKQLRSSGRSPYFAPSDVKNYKLILWYANNPKKSFIQATDVHFSNHNAILSYFVNNGGSVIFTGTTNISKPAGARMDFLEEYAGLRDTLSDLNSNDFNWASNNPAVSNSPLAGLNGSNSFTGSTIDSLNTVYTVAGIYPFPAYFGPTPLGSIGSITFLNINEAQTILTCIPNENFPDPDPYDGAPMGSKYTPGDNSGNVYILGFPLFYFDVEQVRSQFLNIAFDEIGISYTK